MVKNPPFNTGDISMVPGQGTKILQAAGQLSPSAATAESTCSRAPPLEKPTHCNEEPMQSKKKRPHALGLTYPRDQPN